LLAVVLIAIALLLLATATAWTETPRCAANLSRLGCAIATHETLASGLIAAFAALFGAWLAFSAAGRRRRRD
jgi:hypothetical protein